ncbi:DUF4375 domain-containing protein [Steroidobacter flavus]|uniref:DUF4375 domain-containing protein n=1 Tax=Steroidobacter flavus TaxID=1842136 RepID=A0ABV8T3E6_9GAMM
MATVRLSIEPVFWESTSVGTVEIIKLVQLHAGVDLGEAKRFVDRCVFDGEAVAIPLPSHESAESFIRAVSSLPGPAKMQATLIQSERELAFVKIEQKGNATYDSLSEPERVWFTITRLIFCIRNGGLPSYFYNGYAKHVVDCMQALQTLGAVEMLEMVRRMNRIDWEREPGVLDVIGGLIKSWTGADARSTQRELREARRVEEALDEYVTKHLLGDGTL